MIKTIFLHGLGQTAQSWDKTLSMLPDNRNVDCVELSQLLEGNVTYDNLYRNFVEYCKDFPKVHLCGLSLGAVVALHYAIDYPEKVQSLILIAGQYKMPKALLKFQNILFRLMPEKAFGSMGFKKEEVISLTKSMMTLDFEQQLQNIHCNVLLICGEKDHANRKAAQVMEKCMPKAELHIIKGAGHEVNVERPWQLADEINKFL